MKEEKMTVYDIITKLVGPVKPIGSTQTDNERFENLKVLTWLVNKLLTDIDEIEQLTIRHEYSIQRAAKYASQFLDDVGISN